MKRKMLGGVLFAVACSMALLAGMLVGCGTSSSSDSNGEHEAITIQAPFRNVSLFVDEVKKAYPEINLQVIPYSGTNYTAYAKSCIDADEMSDIYMATVYDPNREHYGDKLIDLSGYGFTDNYAEARLQDVTDDGAICLLPTYYTCLGITYNKTLLKEHGWKLPTNLKELESLAAKAKKAGVRLCLDQTQLPGYGFQYWCNILDTVFLNTPEGRIWQSDYLDGKTNISKSPAMKEAMQTLERWREIGMLNDEGDPKSDDATRLEMAKGNTLFMLGASNIFSEGDTDDEFGLMPYLSEDGKHNAFILNVSRYAGLNKHLQDAGNEQKLEDALHVMEVLSTVDGMSALNSAYKDASLLPLKDYKPSKATYYADIIDELNDGITAPFIYSGWENTIVPIGNAGIKYVRGKSSLGDFIEAIDDAQSLLEDNSSQSYTTVTEKFDVDNCAKLVGICFAQATDSDIALISKDKYYYYADDTDLNLEGVSGQLFPGPVTDQEITAILPTGWANDIQTVALSGKRVRELLETGYDRNGDGNCFPYELVAPEGFELDDNATYKIAIAGVTEEVGKEGKLKDSGVLGLAAAQKFFKGFDSLSPADLVWNK